MNKYHCSGFRSVRAESMEEAAHQFARRAARNEFGRSGDCRTCTQTSYSMCGTSSEYSAFIGRTKGNETTGHNVNFMVIKIA